MLGTDAKAAGLGTTEASASPGAHRVKWMILTLLVASCRISNAILVST